MEVETLLKEYGYTEVNPGIFMPARPSSEVWVKVEGGWNCYAVASSAVGGGAPWGKRTDSGRVQVPFTQKTEFADIGGLHPANPEHEAMFEWVWPDERLVEIYTYAPKHGEGNQFTKVQNKDGTYTFKSVST